EISVGDAVVVHVREGFGGLPSPLASQLRSGRSVADAVEDFPVLAMLENEGRSVHRRHRKTGRDQDVVPAGERKRREQLDDVGMIQRGVYFGLALAESPDLEDEIHASLNHPNIVKLLATLTFTS